MSKASDVGPDVSRYLSKYPLILPRPSSVPRPTENELKRISSIKRPKRIRRGPRRVYRRRTASKDNNPGIERKFLSPDQPPIASCSSQEETDHVAWSKVVPLSSLIEKYIKPGSFQFETSPSPAGSDSVSCDKAKRREKAVQESLSAHNFIDYFSKERLENFIEKLGQYRCFSTVELVAAKKELYLLQNEAEKKNASVFEKVPLLFELLTNFQDTRLREMPSQYANYTISFKREQAVLNTIKQIDIYNNPTGQKIDQFFTILGLYNIFRPSEIAAVKNYAHSLQQKHYCIQDNYKVVYLEEYQGYVSQKDRKSKSLSLGNSENQTMNEEETLTCPICQQKIDDNDVWRHIVKKHIDRSRVSEQNLLNQKCLRQLHGNQKCCTHCFEMGFSSVNEVMKHEIKIHGTSTKNCCTFCGGTCENIFQYCCHIAEQHGIIFQCTKCNEEFCLKNDLKFHMKLICCSEDFPDFRQKYFCPFCNVRLLSQEKTFDHLFNKYNASKPNSDSTKELYCFLCELPFETHEELELHLEKSDKCSCKEPKSYGNIFCYACKEGFENQNALEFHQSAVASQMNLAPYARPRNFKSTVFTVTCDVKRLRRADLSGYPHALESILKPFEGFHALDEKEMQSNERSSNREECDKEKNSSSKTTQDEESKKTHQCALLPEEKEKAISKQENGSFSKTQPQNVIVKDQADCIKSTEDSDAQINIAPFTLNDGKGNTVIISNQQGGSNTIILGNCCSANKQACLTPDMCRTEIPQVSVTHTETKLSSDSRSAETNTFADDEKSGLNLKPAISLKETEQSVEAITNKVKEAFERIDGDMVLQSQHKQCNEKQTEDKSRAEEIRAIVRDEFRKYFGALDHKTMHVSNIAMNAKNLDDPSKQIAKSFVSDRDSMQALYGIKSESEHCLLRNDQQFESPSSIRSKETKDGTCKKTATNLESKLEKELGDTNNVEMDSTNDREIKAEPESPPIVYIDRIDEHYETGNEKNISMNSSDLPKSVSNAELSVTGRDQIQSEYLTEIQSFKKETKSNNSNPVTHVDFSLSQENNSLAPCQTASSSKQTLLQQGSTDITDSDFGNISGSVKSDTDTYLFPRKTGSCTDSVAELSKLVATISKASETYQPKEICHGKGDKSSVISANQCLPGLTSRIAPANQSILHVVPIVANQSSPGLSVPLVPGTPYFSSQSLASGNHIVPGHNIPLISGTQTISSLNLPVMSPNQAFSTLTVPTANLILPSPRSTIHRKTNTSLNQSTTVKSVQEESTILSTARDKEKTVLQNHVKSKNVSVERQSSCLESTLQDEYIMMKEETEDIASLSNAEFVSQETYKDAVAPSSQNKSLNGSTRNESLPVQSVGSSNQIFLGQDKQIWQINQTKPVLPPGQDETAFLSQCQTLPNETAVQFASQAEGIQAVNKTSEANIIPVQPVTTTSENMGIQNCSLKFVGATSSGFLFQGSGEHGPCLILPKEAAPKIPISPSRGIRTESFKTAAKKTLVNKKLASKLAKALKTKEKKSKAEGKGKSEATTNKTDTVQNQISENVEATLQSEPVHESNITRTKSIEPQKETHFAGNPDAKKHSPATEPNLTKVFEKRPRSFPIKPKPTAPKRNSRKRGTPQATSQNNYMYQPGTIHLSANAPAKHQQFVGIQQNMAFPMQNCIQVGTNLQQNSMIINQGVPVVAQQNSLVGSQVMPPRFTCIQNYTGPVQNTAFQPGQIIPQRMVYQPIQVQQGSIVVPQLIMAGNGSSSNSVMFVEEKQNNQSQNKLIMAGNGSSSNSVMFVEEKQNNQSQNKLIMAGNGSISNSVMFVEEKQNNQSQNKLIMAGNGSSSNSVMFVEEKQNNQSQNKLIMAGNDSSSNSVMFVEEKQNNEPQNKLIMAGNGSSSNSVMFVEEQKNNQPQNKARLILPASQYNQMVLKGQASGPVIAAGNQQQPTTAKKLDNLNVESTSDVASSEKIPPDVNAKKPEAGGIAATSDSVSAKNTPPNFNMRDLIKEVDHKIFKDSTEDVLNYFKTFIESGRLPPETAIDKYIHNHMQLTTFSGDDSDGMGRFIVHTKLQALIDSKVDAASSSTKQYGYHKHVPWTPQEDSELITCFAPHFVIREVPLKAKCRRAVVFAKTNNLKVKRRSFLAIRNRVMWLLGKAGSFKKNKTGRKRKRDVMDNNSGSEYDPDDLDDGHQFQSASTCSDVLRERLSRKVKDKNAAIIEASYSDFEEDFDSSVHHQVGSTSPVPGVPRERLRRKVKNKNAAIIEASSSDSEEYFDSSVHHQVGSTSPVPGVPRERLRRKVKNKNAAIIEASFSNSEEDFDSNIHRRVESASFHTSVLREHLRRKVKDKNAAIIEASSSDSEQEDSDSNVYHGVGSTGRHSSVGRERLSRKVKDKNAAIIEASSSDCEEDFDIELVTDECQDSSAEKPIESEISQPVREHTDVEMKQQEIGQQKVGEMIEVGRVPDRLTEMEMLYLSDLTESSDNSDYEQEELVII